jgi:hypothetical protein
MKIFKIFSLLLIGIAGTTSCKKNNTTAPATNWAEELKGTVWAGDYNYTAGAYTGLQPFSVVMANDGTLTWSDNASTRPGGNWSVTGNKVTIKFPGGAALSADVTNDSWSNFKDITSGNGFQVTSIQRAVTPSTALLDNTNWSGTFNGKAVTINFLPFNKLVFSADAYANKLAYTIEGAGFRFTYLSLGYIYYSYATILKNTSLINGLITAKQSIGDNRLYYYPWTATK